MAKVSEKAEGRAVGSTLTEVVVINLRDCSQAVVEITPTGQAFNACQIQGKVGMGSEFWVPLASVAGDYTTPNYPVRKASASLVTLGAGTTGWAIVDVGGFSALRIVASSAAGTGTATARVSAT